MWRKILTLVMAVVFLSAMVLPVNAHDGRLPRYERPDNDEQPWGGEHNNTGDVDLSTSIIPGIITGLSFAMIANHFSLTIIRFIEPKAPDTDITPIEKDTQIQPTRTE